MTLVPSIKEEKDLIDNITYFRHILYPKVIVKNPRYIFQITALKTNNIYYYAANYDISLKDIYNLLKDYMYAKEEYELFKFDPLLFKIKTIKRYDTSS